MAGRAESGRRRQAGEIRPDGHDGLMCTWSCRGGGFVIGTTILVYVYVWCVCVVRRWAPQSRAHIRKIYVVC